MPSYMRHNHKRQYRGPDIALCRCIPATYRLRVTSAVLFRVWYTLC